MISKGTLNDGSFDSSMLQHLSFLFPETKTVVLSPANVFQMKSTSSPYIVTVLQFLSLLGFSPFYIQRNQSTGYYYIVHLNIFRKAICAFIHACICSAIVWYFVSFCLNEKELSSNFTQTFDMVTNVSAFLLSFLFMNMMWRKQEPLLKLAEVTRVDHNKSSDRNHKLMAATFLTVTYLTCMLVHSHYNQEEIVASKDNIFANFMNEIPNFVTTIAKICILHFSSLIYLSYAFIVMIPLAVRGIRHEFCRNMEETLSTIDVQHGFELYMNLKEVSTHITDTVGSQVLTFYIMSVAYFAKIPETSFWNGIGHVTAMLVCFGCGAILWLVSAEFHMTVRDTVQNWATQMQDQEELAIDTRIRLMSVVNDNLLDPIGISCKFFTISYGFLGSMMGLIVTYAIIVFQMQSKPQASITGTSAPTLYPNMTNN